MTEGYVEHITDISIKAARMIDSDGKSFVKCEYTPNREFELLTLLEFLRYRILHPVENQHDS